MQKKNKIFMGIISVLLCLTLLSTSLLSSVFARYTRSDGVKVNEVGIKKLGLTATSGTDLSSSYKLKVDIDGDGTLDEINAVQSSENVIAPGTHGCLAWVRVKGTPEVKYDLDFTGSFSMGTGYYNSSKLVVNSAGTAVHYFPMVIYLVAYDVIAETNGVLTLEKATVTNSNGQSVRLTNTNGDVMEFGVCHLKTNDYLFSNDLANGRAAVNGTLSNFPNALNGSNADFTKVALNSVFDNSNNSSNVAVDRIYTIQWYWPYNNSDTGYPYSSYKKGSYQQTTYDSQVAEAIANGSTAFTVTADLDVEIKQSSPAT